MSEQEPAQKEEKKGEEKKPSFEGDHLCPRAGYCLGSVKAEAHKIDYTKVYIC